MSMLERATGPVVSVFRIVVGLLFACHGASSIFGVFGGVLGRGGTLPLGVWPGWWAALIQLVGGALVMIGLVTRPLAVLCSGSMAYAYFSVHQERALRPIQNGGELAALFCWAFLLVAVTGPGPWSVDALLARAPTATAVPPAGQPAHRPHTPATPLPSTSTPTWQSEPVSGSRPGPTLRTQ